MFGKSISLRCQIGRVTWLISLPQSAMLLPVMPARLYSLLLLCYESLCLLLVNILTYVYDGGVTTCGPIEGGS